MTKRSAWRSRYPLRAWALMAFTALVGIVEIAAMVVLWMPIIPFIPMLFAAMIGQGFLLASVVEYTASVARPAAHEKARNEPSAPPPANTRKPA